MKFTLAILIKQYNKHAISDLIVNHCDGIEVDPYIRRTKSQMIEDAKEIRNIYELKGFFNCDLFKLTPEIRDYYYAGDNEDILYYLQYDDITFTYDEDGNELYNYTTNGKYDGYDNIRHVDELDANIIDSILLENGIWIDKKTSKEEFFKAIAENKQSCITLVDCYK